jgi:hypothetical protein
MQMLFGKILIEPINGIEKQDNPDEGEHEAAKPGRFLRPEEAEQLVKENGESIEAEKQDDPHLGLIGRKREFLHHLQVGSRNRIVERRERGHKKSLRRGWA